MFRADYNILGYDLEPPKKDSNSSGHLAWETPCFPSVAAILFFHKIIYRLAYLMNGFIKWVVILHNANKLAYQV